MNLTKIFLTFGDINSQLRYSDRNFLKKACTVYTMDASEPCSKPNRNLNKSVFHERGKPKYLEKTSQSKVENRKQNWANIMAS